VILRNADDPNQSCGIGALSIDGLPSDKLTQQLMDKYKIHVRTRVIANEFDCIRVTPNVYASIEDIDRFTRAITAISSRL
jgi:selenocysteine lyase/cysteine desulfurase